MKAEAKKELMIEKLKECLQGEEIAFAFLFGSWAGEHRKEN